MVKEIYIIIASQIDEETGAECVDLIHRNKYDKYPSDVEIAQVINKLNGDVARVEKRYKLISK